MTDVLSSLVGSIQFSSGPFLVFLALAVIVYFVMPGPRTRAAWLLAVSMGFYLLLSPPSLGVLLGVAAVSYGAGLVLGPAGECRPSRDRTVLFASLALIVAVLVGFKYLGLLAEFGNGLLRIGGLAASVPVLRIALPLGISFWTFQSIAYLVDVYRGKTPPERNAAYYLLAVLFFPVVTSGPITRIQALADELRTRHPFDYDNMQSGLLLIGRGFFKKLMIADRLAVFVDTVFAGPQRYGAQNGSLLFVAAVFFAVQLYCDFSGYTDIVRGSARLFGVELPINFRAPYFARSVRDFWRRWHVSLMQWLKEYLYIPLGGGRNGTARRYANLLVVFAISGLWHGAGLTYLVWGLLNGFYQIAGQLLSPLNDTVVRILRVDRDAAGHHVFQTGITFLLVTVAWVFFRAESLADAVYIVPRMFIPTLWVFTDGMLLKQGLSAPELGVAIVSATVVFSAEWLSLRRNLLGALNRQHLVFRWATYYALILVVVVFGTYGGVYSAADFLYFKY